MKIIYNAKLLDETMHTNGAVVIKNGKIALVLKGNFKTKNAVLKAAGLVAGRTTGHAATTGRATSAGRRTAVAGKSAGIGTHSFADIALSIEQIEFIDAGGLTLAPAFIDMHAHFRYPGQPQKEDLDSALAAADAGGFGTLVLMPNTNPVVSSIEEARAVMSEVAAQKKSGVFQTVSITKRFGGSDTSHIDALDKKTVPVITEDGKDVPNAAVMLDAMKKAAKKGIIVACHSEDTDLCGEARTYRARALALMKRHKIPAWGGFNKKALSQTPQSALKEIKENIAKANSILALAEDIATNRNLEIAKEAGCKIHICHVSTRGSIEAVRRAKKEAARSWKQSAAQLSKATDTQSTSQITCEVTPHHIGLVGTAAPEIFAFVNPPLRTESDRAALIEALRDGTADTISTDHAPHTLEDKANGAPGFSGLETAYALCHTVLVEQEKFSEQKLSSLMSANAARILGLKKGLLKKGYEANLVLLDPKKRWRVNSANFLSRGKATPLEGKTLVGKVIATIHS